MYFCWNETVDSGNSWPVQDDGWQLAPVFRFALWWTCVNPQCCIKVASVAEGAHYMDNIRLIKANISKNTVFSEWGETGFLILNDKLMLKLNSLWFKKACVTCPFMSFIRRFYIVDMKYNLFDHMQQQNYRFTFLVIFKTVCPASISCQLVLISFSYRYYHIIAAVAS